MSTFVVPLGLLSYLYVRIGLKLWYRQMPGNVDINRDLTMQTKRAKVSTSRLVSCALHLDASPSDYLIKIERVQTRGVNWVWSE